MWNVVGKEYVFSKGDIVDQFSDFLFDQKTLVGWHTMGLHLIRFLFSIG